jgi:hypothetical protein
MKNSIIKALVSVLILYTSYFSYVSTASAQMSIPLMVMPARQEIEVDPGEQKVITLNFYNQSDDPVTGFFKTADFIVDDNKGTPRLFENPEDAPTKYAASNWFTLFYDRASLPAHDKVSLQTTINVPLDANPGGRYVAVYFEQGANVPQALGGSEEAGVGTSSRIASLVYLRVRGPITEKGLVARFFTPSFFEYGPVKVSTDILNRGDYHIKPNGIISMTNMFGGLVDQVKLDSQNIFPDTSRGYENELGTKWMAGRYKVDLAASYGSQGQAMTASTYVWVFPWRVATAVILTLVIIYIALSNLFKSLSNKETNLEQELEKEKVEIEKLKEALRKKRE